MTGFDSKRQAALDKVAQPEQEPVAWEQFYPDIGKPQLKQEPVAWKNAAIRLGEELSSVGPDGYYDMTAQQWLDWAMEQEPRGKNSLAQPEQEPVGKLQEATAERAWFTIAELNAWADKKLSENPHWVMPKNEPERDEPPPKRQWVGLTDDEVYRIAFELEGEHWRKIADAIEAKLKEKNFD